MRDALLRAGDRPLLIMGERRRSGAELEARAGALARELDAAGLRGRRIGLWQQNAFASVEAHLAVEWVAATRVPVDPGAAPAEAAAVFAAAGVDAVVADLAHAAALGGDALVHDDARPTGDGGFAPVAADPDTVLHLFPRSVEGGELRGVPVSYDNWAARLDQSEALLRDGTYGPPLGADECFLTAQQVMHGTSMIGTFPFLRLGLPQVLLERFDARTALDAIVAHGVTTTFFVPGMVTRLVEALDGRELPLRRLLYGGAPFPREELLAATRALGDRLVQLYGHWAGAWPISVLSGADHLRILREDTPIGASCGRPVMEIKLRGGELCVRGPMVVRDYADPDGWYGLGDLAELDADGYLYLRGRLDGLINTGAYHVYPREIEEALTALPGVRAARVTGEQDPKWGQAITAYVVGDGEADALRAALRTRLAAYKVPKRIEFVTALEPR
ncbi:MAG TPA: AMP-binding protein [Solirubrobacter sp.]|nr:AMP-binding protein [Solirubrobacter sp.]